MLRPLDPDLDVLYPEKEFNDLLDCVKDLGVVIVGFGKMGILHGTILNLLVGDIVKAVVDRSFLVSFGFSRLLKSLKFYRGLDNVLDGSCDVFYVTTSTQSHYGVLRYLLNTGVAKAVFVEKPPTTNFKEFAELADMIGDRIVMVGLQKRYALPLRHAKTLIENDVLGDIERVECYIRSGDIQEKTKRFKPLGRGVLLDLSLIHISEPTRPY